MWKSKRNPAATALPYLLALLLVACGDSNNASSPATTGDLSIRTLSNRADMISDSDALLEISLPTGANFSDLKLDVDGSDVTNLFAVRSNGRVLGVITELKVGQSTLTATLKNAGKAARLLITNADRGGPIFSGPQIQPWICATKAGSQATVVVPNSSLSATVITRTSGLDSDPVDTKCNAPAKFTYYYQPAAKAGTGCTLTPTGPNPCFVIYNPATRPPDSEIANFTNDRGETVKSMLRLELGTADRGEYQILTYFDPSQPWAPWTPQRGWNGKLHWKFGAAASGNRFQQNPGTSVWDVNALAAGFMVANAELTNHLDNPNEILATEQMMMVKEHIVDTYGEIRYTMADGESGGAIMQTLISSAMPGLLQGLQTGISYPEGLGFFGEVKECGILGQFYQTTAGSALTASQRESIEGKPNAYCQTWISSFTTAQIPTVPNNCGNGFPASIVYDPSLRPSGQRCDVFETYVNVLGTVVDADKNNKPKLPYDNVGVQYGLLALKSGSITPEQFVQLNEAVGAYDYDMNWTGNAGALPARRFESVSDVFPSMYQSGLIANAKNLAKVAIIDLRPERGPDIHQAWRSAQIRARLDAGNGGHANHVIRGSSMTTGAALKKQAFSMMDRWLAAVEADKASSAIEQKIVLNKPTDVHDGCYANQGETAADLVTELTLADPACPIAATLAQQKSPRIIAGGPLSEDIFKCQLKPFDPSSADYGTVVFNAAQVSRLKATFPEGVCDWSRPGVGQTSQWVPTSYMGGPGGTAIPKAPSSGSF